MTDAHADEHPEEALDHALLGTLTAAEQASLDRHLAICSACAAHLTLATSARSAGALPAHEDRLAPWAVERVIARLDSRRSARWWDLSPRWAWAFGAVLLLVATAVSAKLWRAREMSAAAVSPDAKLAAPTPPRRAQAAPVLAERAVDTPPEPPAPRRSPTPAAAESQPTAAELFDRAHQLERQGKIDGAIALYLRLQRGHPGTAEARLSSALVGRMFLDRKRPAEALAQFDRHLSHGGAAGEEALAGRATSLQQLGRRAEEAAAWRALLERHPGSVYADRARARLRDLSAR